MSETKEVCKSVTFINNKPRSWAYYSSVSNTGFIALYLYIRLLCAVHNIWVLLGMPKHEPAGLEYPSLSQGFLLLNMPQACLCGTVVA